MDVKIPAVSGSSGHLVVERKKKAHQEMNFAGKAFADPDLTFAEAMQGFVKASRPLTGRNGSTSGKKTYQQSEFQELRQAEIVLRNQHRETRKRRALEDELRQVMTDQNTADNIPIPEAGQTKSRLGWGVRKAKRAHQKELREQRRRIEQERREEDRLWRIARKNVLEKMGMLPDTTSWFAILIITDNCTRQCLGLPIFLSGSHVTAEMVVTALRTLLPANLEFLISDRGSHFTSDAFKNLARDTQIIHVVVARHRPQSNGIAERFVRTLKDWLKDKIWLSERQLLLFLQLFLSEYNNRPHQGLPIPGLSPNEFANRFWLL